MDTLRWQGAPIPISLNDGLSADNNIYIDHFIQFDY